MPRIELLDPTQNGGPAEHLENKLRHLVVGQDEAIHQIVRAYQTYLAGLSPVGRPIGNFLFLGPTGSGKTRIVEATAESLLKNSRSVIKIDCAEFQHSHEIAKPIGSPPGYTKRQDDLADVLTEELGAPRRFAKKVQSNSPVIRREPTGVVGVITPWNWPINQFVVKAFPAFATGRTAVHKPSEVAPIAGNAEG